ncbi:hypothetical protein J4Q44_G00028190 [Coregonus suidteri]|uniref:MTSS I-BAR domain containing 1 n=1 Tax=Coregonus suidteri TaxID=861788 RepID=A0AAN8MBQ0_9TELE
MSSTLLPPRSLGTCCCCPAADALGRGDIQPQLDSAMQDVSDKYLLLEETEKQAVRKALIEERSRLCTFVSMLRPVVDEEISMLGEVTHLQTISDDLKMLTMDPHKLPPASEQVILDLKGSDYNWSYQTPPSSPSTTMSRKSSMCSSLNSINSSDSRSSGTSHSHSPSSSSSHYGCRSSTLPQQAPARLSSISSHDSGFISQPDAYTSKSPSPMPQETLPRPCSSSGSSEASETCQSVSECSSPTSMGSGGPLAAADKSWSRPGSALLPKYPHYCTLGPNMVPSSKVPSWKDWAKPGPYDQPMVNTLRRRKDKEPAPADISSVPLPLPAGVIPAPENRSLPLLPPYKACEMEAHEELALALSRGLQLDSQTQRSSRDSLQCSSGYSTQSTTPCCSEDTIPSQDSPYLTGRGSGLGGSYPFFPPSSHSSSITSSSSCPSQSWSRPGSAALLPKYPHYCTLGPNMVPTSKVPGWKDWAKPGPYDQPMVNTLRRRKDKEPAPAYISSVPLPAGVIPAPENRSLPLPPPYKACEMEAHEELTLALSRGLQLDSQTQRSSRDSLQCSSGYSTQSTTPCCSEDTIPSQVSDYDYFSMGGDQEVDQQEFDKSSTIPRNSDISQSYRRMFQSKRPASTAGLPSTAGPVIMTPGVATIRRTPSTKPSARRGITGPIPIRTPVIPVKIPTVPGLVGGGFPGGWGFLEDQDGQATTNPPLAPHQPVFQCQGEGGSLEDGEVMDGQGGNMLLAIQRGVKLKRTNTNDRSAPRFA